jgi:hypothetical protein
MKKIARRIAEGKEEFYCVFAVSFKSCDSTDVICYDFNKWGYTRRSQKE